jgi:hypothetical protein
MSEEVMKEAWAKMKGVLLLSQPRAERVEGVLLTTQGPPREWDVMMERF